MIQFIELFLSNNSMNTPFSQYYDPVYIKREKIPFVRYHTPQCCCIKNFLIRISLKSVGKAYFKKKKKKRGSFSSL